MSHLTELHELALQYGLPVIQLDGFAPQTEATSLVPLSLALRLKALPLARVGCVLTVVISDPLAITVVDALRFHTGLSVEVVIAPLMEIEAHTPRFYGVTSEPEVELVEPQEEHTPQHEAVFNTRAEALVIAALDLPEVQRSLVRRSSLHKCFWVGSLENQPSCEQVFADALRAMEVGNRKAK